MLLLLLGSHERWCLLCACLQLIVAPAILRAGSLGVNLYHCFLLVSTTSYFEGSSQYTLWPMRVRYTNKGVQQLAYEG